MTNLKINLPAQDQIDHWINKYQKDLDTTIVHMRSGFYVENEIPFQSVFDGDAMDYAGLGRAKFLNGNAIEEVRDTFRQAANSALRAFKIVYDLSDEFYKPDNTRFSSVSERQYIEGAYYALIAGDFELASEHAYWFQDRPNGKKMDPEVNDFAFALKYTLQGDTDKALSILHPRLDKYLKKPPKGGYKRNYFTLTTALVGILEKDEALFNEGLSQQLHFHLGDARGEYKNMPQGFICDDAVALANLGIHHGLSVTVSDYRLPSGLLIEKPQ